MTNTNLPTPNPANVMTILVCPICNDWSASWMKLDTEREARMRDLYITHLNTHA